MALPLKVLLKGSVQASLLAFGGSMTFGSMASFTWLSVCVCVSLHFCFYKGISHIGLGAHHSPV